MKPIPCIVGPTASGKSALAENIAEKLGAEILSADSMQIYKGMDIGTAKVPLSERKAIYHGIDLVSPDEPYSAALFQSYGRSVIEEVQKNKRRTLIVGGTGLYIRAVMDDYQFPAGEQVDNPVREAFEKLLEEQGADALWQRLHSVDPQSAALIHPHNTRRVIRAFELLQEGKSYAEQAAALKSIPEFYPGVYIGLSVDRDVLRERIDRRVDAMVADGLVDEVNELLKQGIRGVITSSQAIGYKEIVAAIEGDMSYDDAIEAIKLATKRYAKRQMTWFRSDKRIQWIDATDANMDDVTRRAWEVLKNNDAL